MADKTFLLIAEEGPKNSVDVDLSRRHSYGAVKVVVDQSREPHKWPQGNYFRDGRRVIDLVLAYQPNKQKTQAERASYDACREIFYAKLRHYGLELEHEGLEESQDGQTCFVKIHAPLECLSKVAEIENLRMPVKQLDLAETKSRSLLEKCCHKDPFKLPWQEERNSYFTAPFRLSRLKDYIVTDPTLFFPQIHRIRLVWEVVGNKLTLEPSDFEETNPLCPYPVGLMWMIDKEIFVAAYPLHSGEAEANDKDLPTAKLSPRQWLFNTWSSWSAWRYYQPLDRIKDYFGEKVGFYFAWLGFYTSSLVLPSILGVITVLYGIIQLSFDQFSRDVCETIGISNLTLCRTCASTRCPFTQLEDSCTDVRVQVVMDNYATPLFGVLMAVWSATFLERWKRAEITLAAHWEVVNIDEEAADQIRPEYQRAATLRELNPVTQQVEPVIPSTTRLKGLMRSAVVIAFMVLLVIGVVSGVTIYKIVMKSIFFKLRDPLVKKMDTPLVALTGSLINTLCILTLEKVYERLAWWLTERELPRTEDEFETSYIFKMFTFQFVNFYSLLFYLAFVAGHVGEFTSGSLLVDHCTPGQCFSALVLQLVTLLTVKQVLNQVMEVGIPMVKSWWRRRKNVAATEENPYMPWERDFDLPPLTRLALFPEYFEMIVQYGFTTIFVTAFPLAPLLSFLNNITEIRVDASKFLNESRRVVPERAKSIGVWFGLINFISHFAVLTNALLIAFSTTFIDKIVYMYFHNWGLEGFPFAYMSRLNPLDWPNAEERHLQVAPWGNISECYYVGMKHPWDAGKLRYQDNEYWWKVNLARVVFVIVFEHFIFVLMGLIDYFIPDVPEEVEIRLKREKFLARQALFEAQFERESEEKKRRRAKKLGRLGSTSTVDSGEGRRSSRGSFRRASDTPRSHSPDPSHKSAASTKETAEQPSKQPTFGTLLTPESAEKRSSIPRGKLRRSIKGQSEV